MDYTVEQLCNDVECLINMERTSSYTPTELDALWDIAISIRRKIESANYAASLPYIFIQCTGNIDFGKIMPGSRDWILDDAEEVIAELRANGLQEPMNSPQRQRWWRKFF
ncbi:MAG: hypothetical protein P8H62_12680 [Henriciella sp.]|nr:hypothetical protein [Henriciella sp.]